MMTRATLEQWLQHLEIKHPQWMELGLARVQQVADRLQLVTMPCPVITVAGTNGKGSTVATLTTIYKAANYQVGCYTSPHLLHYNERIQINQTPATDEQLIGAFEQIEQARGDISLTYFEFSTLAALLLFKQAKLDIIILEVGLGGRLDAVNIIDADIAIITTIALDHQQWLGDTREQIGFEKAGIFKPHKLAICGDFDIPTTVRAQAEKLAIPLYCQTYDFGFTQQSNQWEWWNRHCRLANLPIPQLYLQNVATALQAIYLLQAQLPVSELAIHQALAKVKVIGRWQEITTSPCQVIVDVAHNPAAAKALAEKLQQQPCAGKTYAVVGMLADKDIEHTLQELHRVINAWYVADLSAIPRGASATTLSGLLTKITTAPVYPKQNVHQAFAQAMRQANTMDRIIVFGSFHTVAPILAEYTND